MSKPALEYVFLFMLGDRLSVSADNISQISEGPLAATCPEQGKAIEKEIEEIQKAIRAAIAKTRQLIEELN